MKDSFCPCNTLHFICKLKWFIHYSSVINLPPFSPSPLFCFIFSVSSFPWPETSEFCVISKLSCHVTLKDKHNTPACGQHIHFLVSPRLQMSSFVFLSHPLASSSLSLRVFFKTCVIDIETLIKCRHLWLTETMRGGERGEGPGFCIKRHKMIFNPGCSGTFLIYGAI